MLRYKVLNAKADPDGQPINPAELNQQLWLYRRTLIERLDLAAGTWE